MADDRTIRVRFLAEVNSYLDGVRKAGAATADFGKNISGHGKATKQEMESVGRGALLMAGGITLALGASVKAAIDWESAWAGVNKTVDGTSSQMGELEDGLRGLARELPATHKEIAAVAEAAGALGVQREAILGFTKVMIDLGETTNLTSDQAATSIAQIMNIFGTAAGDVDNFASTLVALGNAGASTESEILDMAQRLAGSGKLIGATEGEVLALANAMSSLGIQAQLGGGAFSRIMRLIYSAVVEGGNRLEGFAKVANMSADQFAKAFRDDPVLAIDGFIKGLNGIEASGGNVVQTLSDLKIKGSQDLAVMLSLKGAGDLLTDGLTLQAKAWEENTALAIEANKRYETTASQLSVLKNNVVDLGIDLGGTLLPALKAATGGVQQLLQGFSAMPDVMKTGVVGIAGLSAAGLGLIGVVGTLGPKVKAFHDSLASMGTGGEFMARNMGKAAAAAGAAGAAIAVMTYVMGHHAKRAAEAEERLQGFVDAIREAGDAAAGTEDRVTQLVTESSALAGVLDSTDTTLHDLSAALSGTDDEFNRFTRGLLEAAEAAGYSGDEQAALELILTRTRGEAQQAAVDVETLGRVEDKTAIQTGGLTRAQQEQKEQTEDLTNAIKELIDANRAAIDPLFGMLDAALENKEAQDALAVAMQEGGRSVAELDALHEAAAKSALGMDAAMLTLAGEIQKQPEYLGIAKSMLSEWVGQGLITEETARRMGVKFDEAAAKADDLAGDRIVGLYVDDQASPVLDRIIAKLQNVVSLTVRTGLPWSGGGTSAAPTTRPGTAAPNRIVRAHGGPVPHLAGGGFPGSPSGTDTVPAWLTPGEYVVRAPAVARLGLGFMDRLNAGGFRSPGGSAGMSLVVNVSVAGSVHSKDSLAREITHSIRQVVRTQGGDVQKVLGQ